MGVFYLFFQFAKSVCIKLEVLVATVRSARLHVLGALINVRHTLARSM